MYQVLNEQLARQRVHQHESKGVRRQSLRVAWQGRRVEQHRYER
ncbi:hypothetical protein [Luteipulveratus mongoliensis]|nr:hypothetical protein [Luteipulveratus mongoliensis]